MMLVRDRMRMPDDHNNNIMEKNQACAAFMHVLSLDIIKCIRSFLFVNPNPRIIYVEGCERQMDCFMTVPQIDINNNMVVLAKAMMHYALDSKEGMDFLQVWQHGCGTCDACKKAKG